MGYISELAHNYLSLGLDRYHTPGHKGLKSSLDLTELGLSGNIFPADAVENAERDTAELYGVKYIRYLTGGSSIGIKAALMPFKGCKVLYAAGVHRAFTEAAELWGVNVQPISGKREEGRVYTCASGDLPAPPLTCEVEKALNENTDAKAVFITSPDYLGRTASADIAELCKARGVSLIADAAHGAHFAFAPGLDKFRFENVADIANMSAHKTLGAYTQSALFAVNSQQLCVYADKALKLLGTTSPNYEMFARLEDCVCEAAGRKDEYLRLKKFSDMFREKNNCLENTDYTRICLVSDSREDFGKFVKNKIMPEAVISGYLVFILTPEDDDEKLGRLYDTALKLKRINSAEKTK